MNTDVRGGVKVVHMMRVVVHLRARVDIIVVVGHMVSRVEYHVMCVVMLVDGVYLSGREIRRMSRRQLTMLPPCIILVPRTDRRGRGRVDVMVMAVMPVVMAVMPVVVAVMPVVNLMAAVTVVGSLELLLDARLVTVMPVPLMPVTVMPVTLMLLTLRRHQRLGGGLHSRIHGRRDSASRWVDGSHRDALIPLSRSGGGRRRADLRGNPNRLCCAFV